MASALVSRANKGYGAVPKREDQNLKEPRQNYDDLVELWVGGSKQCDISVHLVGYVDVIEAPTFGVLIQRDGTTSWEGSIVSGLSKTELMCLLSEKLELHFPDGRVGVAMLKDSTGWLSGIRETPFG